MNKMMKACYMLVLFLGIFLGIAKTVHAEEDNIVVEINEETFPDPVFREHILTGYHYIWDEEGNQIQVVYDANQDGKLSESEIANIQQMLVPEMAIYDLTGIEYFTSLIELSVDPDFFPGCKQKYRTSVFELLSNQFGRNIRSECQYKTDRS